MIIFKNRQQAKELRNKAFIMLQKKTEIIVNVEKWENALKESNDYLKSESLKEIDKELGII
jgi:hypothetical protein